MRRRFPSGRFVGGLCVVLTLGCSQPSYEPTGPVGSLRVAAGSALLPFIKQAAVAIHAARRELEPQIEEARSSAAIHKLMDGEIGMAFTSRALRPTELSEGAKKARALHMVVIGAEALVVIVHPDNPLRDVSSEQLREVFFSGDLKDWADLTQGAKRGPIHILAVNPKTSGTGELFAASIAGDEKQSYVAHAQLVEFSDATVGAVATDPEAISFTGMANVTRRVRAVMLNHTAPIAKAVLDTSYVLNRKLFAISNGPPRGSEREFVKFLLSKAGQNIAREHGITPITLD